MPIPCPSCGTTTNAVHDPLQPTVAPVPGDWTICLHCAAILRLTPALTLVEASPAELSELEERNPQMATLIKLMHAVARDDRPPWAEVPPSPVKPH